MSFFSYRDANLGSYTYIAKNLAILLTVIFLKEVLFSNKKIYFSIEFLLIISWVLVSLLSGLFSSDFNVFYNKFITILQVYLICYVLFNLVIQLKSISVIWYGLYISTLAVSIMVFRNPVLYSELGRYEGTYGNANLFALSLIVSFVFAIDQIFSCKKFFCKLVFVLSIPIFIYMIAGTGSRKAMLAVFILLILQMVLRFKDSIIKRPLLTISMLFMSFTLVVGSAYFFSKSDHFNRLQNIYSAARSGNIRKADNSFRGRLMLYQIGFEKIAESPATGFGLDNFRVVAGSGHYAHSNIMELLISTGIIGFLLYNLIYLSLAVKLFRLRKVNWRRKHYNQYIMTVTLLFIYVLYDLAMVSYYEKLSWLILTGIIGSTYLLTMERPGLLDDGRIPDLSDRSGWSLDPLPYETPETPHDFR